MDTEILSKAAQAGIDVEMNITSSWSEIRLTNIYGCNVRIGSDNMGDINKLMAEMIKGKVLPVRWSDDHES